LAIPVAEDFLFLQANDRRVLEGIACNRRQWRKQGGRGWRSGRKNRAGEQREDFSGNRKRTLVQIQPPWP